MGCSTKQLNKRRKKMKKQKLPQRIAQIFHKELTGQKYQEEPIPYKKDVKGLIYFNESNN
jgi:hypothetical protein